MGQRLCAAFVFYGQVYAEDDGIFKRVQFHNYLEPYPVSECRNALIPLRDELKDLLLKQTPEGFKRID